MSDSEPVTVLAPIDEPPTAIIDSVTAVTDSDNDGFESITLTQTSSDDVGIVDYEWSINGTVVSTAATLTYDFPVGETIVNLLVRDAANQTSTDTVLVHVEEAADSIGCYRCRRDLFRRYNLSAN